MWMLPLYLHVNQKSDYDYDYGGVPFTVIVNDSLLIGIDRTDMVFCSL